MTHTGRAGVGSSRAQGAVGSGGGAWCIAAVSCALLQRVWSETTLDLSIVSVKLGMILLIRPCAGTLHVS